MQHMQLRERNMRGAGMEFFGKENGIPAKENGDAVWLDTQWRLHGGEESARAVRELLQEQIIRECDVVLPPAHFPPFRTTPALSASRQPRQH